MVRVIVCIMAVTVIPTAFLIFEERYTSYEIVGENVNAGLKQFVKSINYPQAITLYCARHSWASIAYKTGVQRSVICDKLGHKNRENRICDIYIHREWKQVWEMNHTRFWKPSGGLIDNVFCLLIMNGAKKEDKEKVLSDAALIPSWIMDIIKEAYE